MATQPDEPGQEAEEEAVATEGAETEQVEQPEAETTDDTDNAPDPVADLAKTMGWRPKEEFRGDPNMWKPAEEYIRAGGEIQRGQSRELKDLRTTMDNIARTNAAIVQSTIRAEHEKLIARYNQAVDEGDGQAAFRIGTEINNLNGQAQNLANPPPAPPPPEANDWVARNNWFTQDPLARDLALNVAERYAQAGKTANEQLQAAEREVRRQYPHLFGSTKGPAGVQPPSSRSGSARKLGSTFADLPAEAKKIAADMAERGVIPDKEAYAKQYWQNAGKRA